MNNTQRRHHQEVAEAIIAATGDTISRCVRRVENPKILRRILRLETAWTNGRPRLRMVRAVNERLAELKVLKLRTCKHCGCTDRQGCPNGCCWVTADTCCRCPN